VSAFLTVQPTNLIKTLILVADSKPVAVLVRGDHELNEIKVKNFLKAAEIQLADARTIEETTKGPLGFSGPVGLSGVTILADHAVKGVGVAAVGANERDAHYVGVTRADYTVDHFGDFRAAQAGDPCPRCEGTLELHRGIEVGHVFKLGTKYSVAMQATFLDADGKDKPIVMGCYGIGVSRTVAAAIEQNHDEDGIIFPPPIAPFTVLVTPVGAKDANIDAAADRVYADLWAAGFDTLLDDRDERPGVKFKDGDLIGIPFRITIGKKGLAQGKVELRNRRTKVMELVDVDAVVSAVRLGVETWSTGGD
jgi:prolyl-tRNA synthetase